MTYHDTLYFSVSQSVVSLHCSFDTQILFLRNASTEGTNARTEVCIEKGKTPAMNSQSGSFHLTLKSNHAHTQTIFDSVFSPRFEV